jgi:hypothetical protein
LKKFMVLPLDGGWLMFGAASTTPFVLSEKPSETRTQEGTETSLPKICRTSFSHPAFEAECAGAERDRLRAEGGFSLADEGNTGIEHRA